MPAITTPTTVGSTPTTFTRAFTFVTQTNEFDDVSAYADMLSGKTKHRAQGSYGLGET
jgi:hypothetical protein